MKIKIYSGLSLTQEQVLQLLPSAEFSSPIKRGDLQKDIDAGFQVIGIIDGLFYRNLAVSPTEILDALRFGIKMFGASSMGALRAAELGPYGMIGVGEIYQHIVNCDYFADELLGQVFIEGETGSQSLAGIDLHLGLAHAVRRKLVSQITAHKIISCYQKAHFTERGLDQLLRQLALQKMETSELKKAYKVLRSLRSLKSSDAKKLIKRISYLTKK